MKVSKRRGSQQAITINCSKQVPSSVSANRSPLWLIQNSSNASLVFRKRLQNCSTALNDALELCSHEDFLRLSCAISCVLNSDQNLTTVALWDAVALYVDGSTVNKSEAALAEWHAWIHRFRSIILAESRGRVTFTLSAMPDFLRSFVIRGIDASHRTIAIVCLAQLTIESEVRCEGKDLDRSDLSIYVEKHWRWHRNLAYRSNICLAWYSAANRKKPSSERSHQHTFARTLLKSNTIAIRSSEHRSHPWQCEDKWHDSDESDYSESSEDWELLDFESAIETVTI